MRTLIFLLLFPFAAIAQDGLIYPADVLSVITTDWNNDGQQDRAVLVHDPSEGMADLYIYLGEGFEMIEHSFSNDISWSGGMWGQQPYLALNDSGSLQVVSMNESIGRNRWHRTLTIAYRNERFVMAGFTYTDYDTLDLASFTDCDVNLLTGNGVVTFGDSAVQKFTLPKGVIYASEWGEEFHPDECWGD